MMNGQRLLITWDTIIPEGIIEYTGVNVAFSGTIIDFHHVVGTWHDYEYNESGTFEGWKESNKLNSLLIQISNADGDISLIY